MTLRAHAAALCRVAAAGWWLFSVYLLLLKPSGAPSGIPYFDKVGHFALFAVWALLLAAALRRGGSVLRPVWSLCLGWAVGSELLQGLLTATRSAEVGDVVADLCGTACALWLWRRYMAK